MARVRHTLLTVILAAVMLGAGATQASVGESAQRGEALMLPTALQQCEDGMQDSGAIYRICMPPQWNGDLVVYAHGYMSPEREIEIPEDQLTFGAGVSVPGLVMFSGYAFATTSYSANGLAVREGIADLVDLVDIFTQVQGAPQRVYLVGVSEGGLITALATEEHPEVFDAALALCGPYGSFERQVAYLADARVLFDYFFPGLMPPSPMDVPQSLMDDWEAYYASTIHPVVTDPANQAQVDLFLDVAGIPYDPGQADTREEAIATLLWYNVFSTNDGIAKLGGLPYGNRDVLYGGSGDDAALNDAVARYDAAPDAVSLMDATLTTSGVLTRPLVTAHTTGDALVPYWHATLYRQRVLAADNLALHEHVRVERRGHCNFNAGEVLGAFQRMVAMSEDPPAYRPAQRVFLPEAIKQVE